MKAMHNHTTHNTTQFHQKISLILLLNRLFCPPLFSAGRGPVLAQLRHINLTTTSGMPRLSCHYIGYTVLAGQDPPSASIPPSG